MITTVVQRWRDRRDSYRPAREVADVARFDVEPIASDAVARAFVERHHYSASYPAARFRFGLRIGERLAGVAVFSHPMSDRLLDRAPGVGLERVELGRFVLLDDVGANAETWLLARCFEALRREGIVGVVSLSDPMPRTTSAGAVVFGGHVGTIYQAANATYCGRATPRTLRLLADGRAFSQRARSKLMGGERGWRYAAEQLVEAGAEPILEGEDVPAWARRWIGQLTRPLRHQGNHVYTWAVDRRARRHLPASLPYPKLIARAA